MSPQREAAISYLRAQVARYRADLSVWRSKARRNGAGLAQSMIVTPMQGLIDDAAQLIERLRRRQGWSREDECGDQRRASSTNGETGDQA